MEETPEVSATTPVSLEGLLEALEYVSSVGFGVDAAAYVSRDTGSVYFVGTDMEPEDGAPEDLESSDRYVAVPSKPELDLGKRVALRFAEAQLPEQYERIRGHLKKGAITYVKARRSLIPLSAPSVGA